MSRPYLIVEISGDEVLTQCQDGGKNYYDVLLPEKEGGNTTAFKIIGNIYNLDVNPLLNSTEAYKFKLGDKVNIMNCSDIDENDVFSVDGFAKGSDYPLLIAINDHLGIMSFNEEGEWLEGSSNKPYLKLYESIVSKNNESENDNKLTLKEIIQEQTLKIKELNNLINKLIEYK